MHIRTYIRYAGTCVHTVHIHTYVCVSYSQPHYTHPFQLDDLSPTVVCPSVQFLVGLLQLLRFGLRVPQCGHCLLQLVVLPLESLELGTSSPGHREGDTDQWFTAEATKYNMYTYIRTNYPHYPGMVPRRMFNSL